MTDKRPKFPRTPNQKVTDALSKEQFNVRISALAVRLIIEMSKIDGIPPSAFIEIVARQEATRRGIPIK